ncbi:MAG: acetate uptake transporter family protein [Gemmataceae bacterium]|nr:acetate uptake transporter family protein [Gemmataceae bacterium]
MAARRREELHQVAPVLRVAPLGELRIYTVTEAELDTISRGSPGSIFLNFAIGLLPLGFSFLLTLLTTRIEATVALVFFVSGCIIFFLAGIICAVLAYYYHSSTAMVIQTIKDRMPPPTPIIQEEAARGTDQPEAMNPNAPETPSQGSPPTSS